MQEDTDMKQISIFATAAAALLLCACSLQKTDAPLVEGAPIQISAKVGEFQTKADDNGFESGDSFGLFALAPINAVNIKYTLGADGFTSANKLTWGVNQVQATQFVAYYPYAQSVTLDGALSFEVKADQTNHASYTASDFMFAQAEVMPEEKVVLNFQHLMSRMIFDVAEVPEDVVSLTLEGVATKASIKYDSQEVYATGNEGSIKAAAVVASGQKAWALITVPQTCTPTIKVKTVSGKEYSIVASRAISFFPGCEVSAKVRVIEGSNDATFTATITEWDEGENMQFVATEGEYWHSIGTGKYIDDTFCNIIGNFVDGEFKHYEWDVEFEENILMPGYYRIVNPYKTWKYCPKYWSCDTSKDYYMYIDATNPGRVYIPTSPIGLNLPPDGSINNIGTLCEENLYGGYYGYGTLDEYGCITFPQIGLFGMVNARHYYGNNYGQTYITLPGGTRTRIINDLTSLNISEEPDEEGYYTFYLYTSMETNAVYFQVYQGEIPEDYGETLANKMISDGQLGWTPYEVPEPETEMTFRMKLTSGGTYSAVAFTFDYGPHATYWWSWRYLTITL